MKIRCPLLFLTFLLIFIGRAYAETDVSQAKLLFQQGNTRYIEGEFKESIDNYEKILSEGFESGPLYYNLGNAYFKHGALGLAILNYRRAQRLIPADADLKANLNYARSLIKGGVVIPTRNWFIRIFFDLADSFNLNRITLLCSSLYFLLSTALIIFILVKNFKRVFGLISMLVLFLFLISLFLFTVQYRKVIAQQEAVVISGQADSKFEPLNEATTFFSLREGECITIISFKDDWVKIRRPDGKQGWVKKSSITVI